MKDKILDKIKTLTVINIAQITTRISIGPHGKIRRRRKLSDGEIRYDPEENTILGLSYEDFIIAAKSIERYDLIWELILRKEEINVDIFELIDVSEEIPILPKKYRTNEILNYLIDKKRYYEVFCYFNINDYTGLEEEFTKAAEEAIPKIEKLDYNYFYYDLTYNKYILNAALKFNSFSVLDKMRMEIPQEYIKENVKLIHEYLKNIKSSKFYSERIVYEYVLSQNDLETAAKFKAELHSSEFVRKNALLIAKKEMTTVNMSEENTAIYLQTLFENDIYNQICSVGIDNIPKHLVEQYGEHIINYMLSIDFTYMKTKNQYLFEYILKNKPCSLLKIFPVEMFTETIINENIKVVLEHCNPEVYSNNKKVLLYVLVNRMLSEHLLHFNEKLYTEEIINEYHDQIIEELTKKTPIEYIRKTFSNNNYILKALLLHNEYGILDSIFYYKSIEECDKFIKENLTIILPLLKTARVYLSFLSKSKTLFLEYYNDETLSIYNSHFDKELFTDDFVIDNLALIMKRCENFIPQYLSDSRIIFNELIKQNRFSEAINFNSKFFTEEFIEENFEKFFKKIDYNISLNLAKCQLLFNKILEKKHFDKSIYFDGSFFTEAIIKEYFHEIIQAIGDNLPSSLTQNKALLNECINNNILKYISKFNETLFDEKIINDHYLKLIEYFKEHPLEMDFLERNEHFRKKIINSKDRTLITRVIFNKDILTNEDELNTYSKILNLTKEEIAEKIKKLQSINDEILDTLLPSTLHQRFSCIDFQMLEKISLYRDLQLALWSYNDKELKIFSKIINSLEKQNNDTTTTIYYIINNWHNYKTLLNSIDIDNISNDEIISLTFVLVRQTNFYNINAHEDLNPERFNQKRKDKFIEMDKSIRNIQDIDVIREALIEKKFGIDQPMAIFINERYCCDMETLERSELDPNIKLMLKCINRIISCDSIDELKFLYLTSTRLITDTKTITDLEAIIRGEYAKEYSKKIYKVNKDHLMKESDFKYKDLYNKVCEISYNGKKPQIYIADGDFNMQIHILGAYRHWERPANFKEDWLRPKIAYHGICTSFIGNNQIANARQSHPAYGFDHIEENSLLCAGNYDLCSDSSINQFASSIYKPYNFYTPKEMINKTRHTHNEMVIERRAGDKSQTYKRVPSYIVYFVDDINNESNFDMENNILFNETIQAAVDNDIPIVIVDRLKYAKYERNKCAIMLEQFKNTLDISILRELFLTICNNMIGCQKFSIQPDMEYHKYFNNGYLESVFEEIFNIAQLEEENTKNNIIQELIKLKNNDITMFRNEKIAILLSNYNLDINTVMSTDNKDIILEIYTYYQSSSLEIQEKISKDINDNVPFEEIKRKIKENSYETALKI